MPAARVKALLSSPDRRKFLEGAARGAAGAAVASLLIALYGRAAKALPADAIRPPGAGPEADFLAACVRCGLCVQACPFDTLRLADLGPGEPTTGTPYFHAREVPCEMCRDIPCVKACPTDALDPSLTDISEAKMGIAVLVDEEHCLNTLGMRCDVCYRACPVIDRAITLDTKPNRDGTLPVFRPVVHADACTGCGKCEKACVADDPTIKVLPLRLARGQVGDNYRSGWKERAS